MATSLPNICAYIEATRKDPFLLGNLDLLMEDFMARLKTDCCGPSTDRAQEKSEEKQTTADSSDKQYDTEGSSAPNLFDTLMKSAREALQTMAETTDHERKSREEPESSTDQSSAAENSTCERMIPIQTSVSSEYELKFDFVGCASNSIKLETEEGVLKATGKKEADDGTKTISYERKLPSDVDASSMKAYFLADGMLKIVGKRFNIVKASDV